MKTEHPERANPLRAVAVHGGLIDRLRVSV
jgi:hypothetical protein